MTDKQLRKLLQYLHDTGVLSCPPENLGYVVKRFSK